MSKHLSRFGGGSAHAEPLEGRRLLSAFPILLNGSGVNLATSTAIDSSGHLYAAGTFSGTVDFDPSTKTVNLTASGVASAFVAKYTSAGSLIWARRLGGLSSASDVYDEFPGRLVRVALDSSGNAYVTGLFSGTRDFDPGSKTHNLSSAGKSDAFVAKLSSAGNYYWAKRVGGSSYDCGLDIAVTPSGNVAVTGFFSGTVDFDPGSGVTKLTSAGSTDSFVLRLSNSGSFVWARRLGGSGQDQGYGVAIDSSNCVYTTGLFSGTADFDPGGGTFKLSSAGSLDVYISRLTSGGSFSWAKRLGGGGIDVGTDICLDSSNNVFVSGMFRGTVDFDTSSGLYTLTSAGDFDAFLIRHTSGGTFSLARQIGGKQADAGLGLASGGSSIYLTGLFNGTADFDPSSARFLLTSAGGSDAFVLKLTTSMVFQWVSRQGTGRDEWGLGLARDSSGNVYAGGFRGSAVFDPVGSGIHISDADTLLWKMNASGIFV